MATYYAKKALEILREEGPFELSKRSIRFIFRQPLKPLDPQYHRRFKFHTWKNHLENRIRYDAPPDPYKTIVIQPSEINSICGRGDSESWPTWDLKQPKRAGLGLIMGGNWDANSRTGVENSWIIQGMVQRFGQGVEWEETEYYQYYLKKYRRTNKHKSRGFDDLQSYLEERCGKYDELFNEINSNGYKQGHTGSSLIPGNNQPVRSRLEVLVVVDRKGQICFYEGNHRFGLARALDIEIPAHVLCRHKQWQELRDEIHNNGLPEGREDLRDHPDLQDVLD